ncbi:MAG TPA: helix-turn-helix domain-containing protein, partial [Rhizomicrobium sp.]|nr:helix-turn-helix domain-containing protein [Rhizomicrobium sp.]
APAGAIARAVGTPANTMSAHLTILERAGLIGARREGRTIYYALAPDRLRALFSFLVADCCAGRADLCAPLIAAEPCCEPV